MNTLVDRRTLPGVMLVVIGLALLGVQWFDLGGAAVLAAIAAVFFVAYASTRTYGLLVPGMIFGGLALGVGLQQAGFDPEGGLVVLGLATGFFGIFLIDVLMGHTDRWWPLIPAGILGAVGVDQSVRGTLAGDVIARYWPIAIILAGILVLVRTLQAPRRARSGRSEVGARR